jgi:hypothetical protein
MLTREHFRLSGFQDASPAYEVDAIVDPDQLQLTMPHSQSVTQIAAWMLKLVQHDRCVWEMEA